MQTESFPMVGMQLLNEGPSRPMTILLLTVFNVRENMVFTSSRSTLVPRTKLLLWYAMEKQDILNGIASIKYKFTLSSELVILGALACLAFYEIKKSAKLVKSAIEKRNPKKHRLLSVAICD